MKRSGFKPKTNPDGSPRFSSFTNRGTGFKKQVRKPINKRGPRTRERLDVINPAIHTQARREGWYGICEIKRGLIERGYLPADPRLNRCFGDWTLCHARTRTHRRNDAEPGTPEHEYTVAGGCEYHHVNLLDIPKIVPRAIACEIVMEAIRRRISNDEWRTGDSVAMLRR